MKFLEDAIFNSSRECILFPFAKDRKGYGKVSLDGRMQYAHRIVCERVNGSPKTPKHEAAHLCGNGHLGCINPEHLSWKTRRENELDKNIHGTRARGELVRNAKLTERQAREIIGLRGVKTLDELAGIFGVSRTQVWAIQRGYRWSWLGAKRDTE